VGRHAVQTTIDLLERRRERDCLNTGDLHGARYCLQPAWLDGILRRLVQVHLLDDLLGRKPIVLV
jgi:hypothetical protein